METCLSLPMVIFNVKNLFCIFALGLSSLNAPFILQTLENAYKVSGTTHTSDVFRESFHIHSYAYHKLFLKIFFGPLYKEFVFNVEEFLFFSVFLIST